jgi:hypothetical protein
MVLWQDIWSHDGWTPEDYTRQAVDQKMEFATVGFLMEENKDGIVLACTRALTGNEALKDTNGIWRIPRGVIRKIHVMAKVVL